MKNFRKRRHLERIIWALVIGLTSSVIFLLLSGSQLFKTWELKTYDLRMQITRQGHAAPKNVVLFYVDEPSLDTMEAEGVSWPWPRELYAAALDFCRRGGARAVVFDLFFSEDSTYGLEDDEAFAAGVKLGPPSYFVLFLSKETQAADPWQNTVIQKSLVPFDTADMSRLPVENSLSSLPILHLAETATGFGNAQIPPDPDGVYRRINLIERMGEIPVPSISLKVISDLKRAGRISMPEKTKLAIDKVSVPLDDDGRMMINYYGGVDTFTFYSLAEVLISDAQISAGKIPAIDPSVVKDKVVIIGVAAPGLYDMKSSPFSHVYPGPESQATVIENLLSGDFLEPAHMSTTIAITIMFAVMAAVGLIWLSSSWMLMLCLIVLTGTLIGSGFYLFDRGIWMPMVVPFGALALSAFAAILFKFLTEGRKKREIRRAFRQYLSPHVVDKIADDPESLKLGGEEKEITIFFSDIADFTTISETMPPEDLVKKLNEYFSTTTEIIHEHSGTLDKYIGDAVMAFWGAPLDISDHALRAVRAALDIQRALKSGSEFRTRIGIHTNPAVVGNIGSNIRFNYTAIGDTANLASRLEGLNKIFGTNIIISETTFQKAAGQVEARRVGRVRVKGRAKPIGVFEPLGMKGQFEKLDQDSLKVFEDGLGHFESGSFDKARTIFEKLATEKDDAVSKYYQRLCSEYLSKPPDDFDGVITFTSK